MTSEFSARCEVPFERLVSSDRNARRHFSRVTDLAQSIGQYGLIHNLVVKRRPGSQLFEVQAGERRFRAIGMLRLPAEEQIEKYGELLGTFEGDVPVFIIPEAYADAINLVENIQREQLHPWEVGRRFAEWNDAGYEQEWIATHVHKSRVWVHQHLVIGRFLSPKICEALERLGSDEIIAKGKLYQLAQLHDEITFEPFHDQQLELFETMLGTARKKPQREGESREKAMRTFQRAERLRRMKRWPGHARPYVKAIVEFLFNPERQEKPRFEW